MIKEHKYIRETGQTEYLLGNFNWKSLCHNAEVMDNYAIYLEKDFLGENLGWAVCRQCGSLSNFIMRKE
jgi:hypothetical protein